MNSPEQDIAKLVPDRSSAKVSVLTDGSVLTPRGGSNQLTLPPFVSNANVSLELLPREDRDFFADNAERSTFYVARRAEREQQLSQSSFSKVIVGCMDGRQVNLTDHFGLERGIAQLFSFAGSDMGEPNGRFDKYTLNMIAKADAQDKVVLVLRVMHRSTDSSGSGCAAWDSNYEAAHHFSINNCIRDNLAFNLRPDGSVSENPRFLAIPITSDTYTKALTFHGPGAKVEAMKYLQHDMGGGDRAVDPAAFLTGEELRKSISASMARAFPIDGKLFPAFKEEVWKKLIGELTDMCFANVELVRKLRERGFTEGGDGHKETRVLIGRGFVMYPHPDGHDIDDQLMINDFNFHPPVNDAAVLAIRFALANRLARFARGEIERDRIETPVYINIPFDGAHIGTFGIGAAYADELAFSLLRKLKAVKDNLQAATDFREGAERNLAKAGIVFKELTPVRYKVVDQALHDPMKMVRIIVSLSDMATAKSEPRRIIRLSDYEQTLSGVGS